VRVTADFSRSFPAALRPDVERLRPRLAGLTKSAGNSFQVVVEHELVSIPYRVYGTVRRGDIPAKSTESALIYCVLSRHADGRLRERSVSEILDYPTCWAAPFVLRLLGEYVIEISDKILQSITASDATSIARLESYRETLKANPVWAARLRAQATSYWNAYYRTSIPSMSDYPAIRALELLMPGQVR
jgi:hypothetical protein